MNRTNLDTIVALRDMQPATAELIATHTKQNIGTAAGQLVELVRLGLATRRKFDPFKRAPMTDAERRDRQMGIRKSHCRTGKRPFLYELTPAAWSASETLGEALATLEWEIANNGHQQQRRRAG